MDLKKIFEEYKAVIQIAVPSANIQHVGGSAIPGAITKGDLDIQVRVQLNEMENAIKGLGEKFSPKHAELWNKNFAVFVLKKPDLQIDIMLNVVDSAYDTFFRVRDLLIKDSQLLEEYNQLKIKYRQEPYAVFSKQKRAFFDRLFETYLDLES